MKTIKPYYGVSPMSSSSGPKGSSTNPYTQEEYEEMLDAGTWQGGYVEGQGYCMKQPVVTASYPDSGSSSSSDDSWPSDDSEENDDHNPPTPPTPPTGGSGGGGGGTSHGGGGTGSTTSTPDVLPKSAFRGYLDTDPAGCLRRCREMLAFANCQLSGSEIAMTHFDKNGCVTTATDNFINGLNYIDGQLKQKKPVIVAVDYKPGTSMGPTKDDQAGDHFVIIVGGNQNTGYHYFDPATKYVTRGTSSANKFTREGNLMKSTNTCTGSTHYYTLTSIRQNK